MIRACGDFDVNAPLNTHGHTLLHVAAKNNNVDLIGYKFLAERLISRGANINAVDNLGRTPLAIAVIHNRLEIAEYLLFWERI